MFAMSLTLWRSATSLCRVGQDRRFFCTWSIVTILGSGHCVLLPGATSWVCQRGLGFVVSNPSARGFGGAAHLDQAQLRYYVSERAPLQATAVVGVYLSGASAGHLQCPRTLCLRRYVPAGS